MITREDFFKIKTAEDWNKQRLIFKNAGIEMDREMLEHLMNVFSQYNFSMKEADPTCPQNKDHY